MDVSMVDRHAGGSGTQPPKMAVRRQVLRQAVEKQKCRVRIVRCVDSASFWREKTAQSAWDGRGVQAAYMRCRKGGPPADLCNELSWHERASSCRQQKEMEISAIWM